MRMIPKGFDYLSLIIHNVIVSRWFDGKAPLINVFFVCLSLDVEEL